MAGSGDHLNAVASQPAGSSPTREEFAHLQQFNQLCAKLEQAGIFGAPNSTIGGQTRQNFRTYQQRNVRNQPPMEEFPTNYIPHFTGEEQLKEVLDWLKEVERVFEFLNLPKNKKVKLMAIKLKGYASSWWKQVQMTRIQSGKEKIQSWTKMQQQIQSLFLPLNNEGILFQNGSAGHSSLFDGIEAK
ncbi:hypothetical protein CK203_052777 [Vitis vinifera]|uniref:Retrotransposon gag domain-containing protein n=1 Tax=Vitis vinifera TaxID=29760 RepID=A0A438FUU0_VITVI|nr:hypothetical protein CK203_052777 [Vitis vinifera]